MRKEFKIIAFIMALLIALFALVPSTVVLADDEEDSSSAQLTTLRPTMMLNLEVGGTANISSQLPENFGGNVKYRSDNSSVASVNVDSGVVSAIKEGTATISAYNDTNVQYFFFTVAKTATTTTTTKPSTTMKTLTVLGTLKVTVEKGKTVTLSHVGLSGKVTYRSGNNQIASVSAGGVVTGVKVGTTYIQAFNDTHVQNYEIVITESEKETVTVEETTTVDATEESETSEVAGDIGFEDETTYPDYTSNAMADVSQNNGSLKTKILIITAIIIFIIIVASIIIYRFIAARNIEDYPIDFQPDDRFDSFDESGTNSDEDDVLPEYNFSDNVSEDVDETPDFSGDDIDSSFINEDPKESDDDTFLL